MCERVYVIYFAIHTDMLRNQTQRKKYIVIIVVCILINRNGSQLVEESSVVSRSPRLIKAHFCNSQRFKTCGDNTTSFIHT